MSDTFPIIATENDEWVSSYSKIYGLPEGADAIALGEMAQKQFVLHVCTDDARLNILKETLNYFYPTLEVLMFPAWNCLPYDRISPSNEVLGMRVNTLSNLVFNTNKSKGIMLATVSSVTQKVPPREVYSDVAFSCQAGSFINVDKLTKYLVKNGFNRSGTVREPGEFAIRGGIIDIFPPTDDFPVRLDLFDTQVESIKYFDPLSQRTIEVCSEFKLNPVAEVFLNDTTIESFKKNYRERFGVRSNDDALFENIAEGRKHGGMEHWLPLFYPSMQTVFDYIPKNTKITLDFQFEVARKARQEQILDFYDSRTQQARLEKESKTSVSYHPIHPELLFLNDEVWESNIQKFDTSEISSFKNPFEDDKKSPDFHGERAKNFSSFYKDDKEKFFQELRVYIHTQQDHKNKFVIACYSEGARERIEKIFNDHDIENTAIIDTVDALEKMPRSKIGLIVLPIETGFIFNGYCIISEQDLFGDRLTRQVRKKKNSDNFIQEVSSLKEGDLVVHINHGVGRFISLETMVVGGVSHDCVKIEYEGGDKLYVPVENIEMLSKFGSEDSLGRLDKLGGHGWQARKARIKKDLFRMAADLLKIAAARQLKHADVLEVSEGLYNEFAARFPYSETDDQLTSINAVIGDLHAGRPMDRLVCGDVGFGKTEVALRGAFVAAMAGSQVAIVAPTTLLARQHFIEFKKRFSGLPVCIEMLSRLVKSGQAEQTKKDIQNGQVDIVIGTHALLAESIKFKNLGLLVVDEEQKFGVKQKERLKQLKDNVHILTLTATPIPRTLQLALTGVRDLSLITTPPVDRLAVRTNVLPFDPVIIREALMREHYRGGQSFYVCPRIGDLDEVEEELKKITPELKVIKAHGQMPPTTLEDRMTAFYEGQYDILLATNIIESGLDIPRANTMVVHRSEFFGLSQLYQIRGRIGRSKLRGYAYLTHDPKKKLTKQAEERLKVLETLDTLGAGFQIASHDMDIRGAGNLVGEEQSGHIKEIGIELYQEMLQDAIEEAKSGNDPLFTLEDSWTPQINLGTNVLIPENYIQDLNVRLSMYRRIADLVTSDEIDGFAAEMIDRFGTLPEEVKNLLDVISIKQLCRRANIEKVDAGPKGALLSFRNNRFENVGKLVDYIGRQSGSIRLKPDQKIAVIRSWPRVEDRVEGVKKVLLEIGDLC